MCGLIKNSRSGRSHCAWCQLQCHKTIVKDDKIDLQYFVYIFLNPPPPFLLISSIKFSKANMKEKSDSEHLYAILSNHLLSLLFSLYLAYKTKLYQRPLKESALVLIVHHIWWIYSLKSIASWSIAQQKNMSGINTCHWSCLASICARQCACRIQMPPGPVSCFRPVSLSLCLD